MRRILYGVTWEDYMKLLDATPDLLLRHTYDEGTLEMISPQGPRLGGELVGRMIEAFTLGTDIPIQSIGSTTLRAKQEAAVFNRTGLLPGPRVAGPARTRTIPRRTRRPISPSKST